MLSVPGYMQRKLALVPAAQVDQVTADGMDLVLLSDNGELDTLRVKLYDMSRDQFEQAFGTDGQRSEAGQRAWLEDQRTKKRTAKRARPNQYEIVKKGGRLLLKVGDVFIPRADVLMAFARAE